MPVIDPEPADGGKGMDGGEGGPPDPGGKHRAAARSASGKGRSALKKGGKCNFDENYSAYFTESKGDNDNLLVMEKYTSFTICPFPGQHLIGQSIQFIV